SMWVDAARIDEVTWTQILNGINLFNGAYSIDNPLWSIQWEMIFSFTLPLFVIVAVVVRRWWAVGIAVSIVAVWIGALTNVTAFVFLPVFMIGVLMAIGRESLTRLCARINAMRYSWIVWSATAAAAAVLLIAKWLFGASTEIDWLQPILAASIPLGAALLVLCALGSRGFGRLLVLPPFRFAGRISFSLYLVHVPLIIAIRHAFPDVSENLVIALAIPVAIVVAIVFHRLIEAPAHRLSGLVGRAAASALDSEGAGDQADRRGSADGERAGSDGRRGTQGHSQTPDLRSSSD
ncbi:MAG: acyltransferase family protein, partial [Agromyces sp.]